MTRFQVDVKCCSKRENEMRTLLIFLCCMVVSGMAQQSIRNVDWKNSSYPMAEVEDVPGDVEWMSPRATAESASLAKGDYVLPDCSDDDRCPAVTFDSVNYGALTGIKSTVALVVLTYHSGGTAGWQYVYLYSLKSSRPQLLAWLRTGSRAYQGLREVTIIGGDLVLVVNDPDKRQGDCCSNGTITTRYRWLRDSFSAMGKPEYKTDPPSFDCKKASTRIERMICQDDRLSSLDSQMAESYREVLKDASADRKEIIRRQQAGWFAEYRRTCNAPLSDEQRRDCIEQHLSIRLMTMWK